jgi:hypothetical protein
MRVTNGIPLWCPLFLPVHTVNSVQTLKARRSAASETVTKEVVFAEALDCFGGMLPNDDLRAGVATLIGDSLDIAPEQARC